MKKLLMITSLLFASANVFADTIGIYAGISVWQADNDGSFGVTDSISTAELGLKSDDVNSFYVALEHPLPIIPNIRISQTPLETEGSATLAAPYTFDNITFPVDTPVSTKIDLSHTDYTLYYEILDNIASVDLGISARVFDGTANMASDALSEQVNFSVTVPMLYGRVQFDLPLTGFYVGGTLKYVGLDGDKLQDMEARVGYMTSGLPASVGVELGYRKMSLEVDDDDDLQTDLNFDGAYAGVVFHF